MHGTIIERALIKRPFEGKAENDYEGNCLIIHDRYYYDLIDISSCRYDKKSCFETNKIALDLRAYIGQTRHIGKLRSVSILLPLS